MKTAHKFFPLMIVLMIMGMTVNAGAQGRGHHNERQKARHHDERSHNRDRGKHVRKTDHHGEWHHRHNDERHHVRRHDHGRDVVHHHVYQRPRYIHYRDYDVYYDIHRNVYISYSGRSWTISASVPVAMRHVDSRRAVRMEVDYDQDDFVHYLEKGRPAYRRIYTGS